jgi:hypothetical protein
VRRRPHAATTAGSRLAPPAGKAGAAVDSRTDSSAERSGAAARGRAAAGRTLTILVVEDDAALAELLRAVLNDEPG